MSTKDWEDFIPADYKKQFADIELLNGMKYLNVYPNAGAFSIPMMSGTKQIPYAKIKRVRWLSFEEHIADE